MVTPAVLPIVDNLVLAAVQEIPTTTYTVSQDARSFTVAFFENMQPRCLPRWLPIYMRKTTRVLDLLEPLPGFDNLDETSKTDARDIPSLSKGPFCNEP